VPVGVDALVETASVVEPEPDTEPGVKDAVAPDGRPSTLKLTLPVNPLIGVTVAAYVVPAPGSTLLDAGAAESEKLATVTVRVAGALAAPALSVTVREAT